MRITGYESNGAILAELGARIKDTRVATGITQAELAVRAGVSQRTVTNVETGQHVTLANLMNVLRALGLLGNLELIVPEQGARPTDLERLGKKRQRVRSSATTVLTETTWVWGEDR